MQNFKGCAQAIPGGIRAGAIRKSILLPFPRKLFLKAAARVGISSRRGTTFEFGRNAKL
jgi:hypothetical protein